MNIDLSEEESNDILSALANAKLDALKDVCLSETDAAKATFQAEIGRYDALLKKLVNARLKSFEGGDI